MRLAAIQHQFEETSLRAHSIGDVVDEGLFKRRPRPDSWSIAECVAHLNLTTRAYLPLIDHALETGTKRRVPDLFEYHRDIKGWLLCWTLEPPSRMKLKTTAPFEPIHISNKLSVMDEFDLLQDELQDRLQRSLGRDLERMQIVSPFNSNVTYNLFSGFCVLAAHQRRHLWQAERVTAR